LIKKLNTNEYDYILAIDQGGHASRATVYTLNGDIKASATCAISTQRFIVGGVEFIQHEIEELYQSIQTVIGECEKKLGDSRKLKIKAGFATQRSTIVCWNYKTGAVLSDAISWQDTRALNYIKNITDKTDLIKALTGLFLTAHYGASKINWCLNNLDAVQTALKNNELCIAPLSSYLLFSCVEGRNRFVDPANAARTLLLNRNTLNWDDALLKIFTIPKSILPMCVSSKFNYGQLLNWDGQCDVQLCTGDQSAAVLSQGLPSDDEFTVNIGSGAFILNINKKNDAPARILSGSIYTESNLKINAWEGTVNGAGTALDWLQGQYPEENIYTKLPEWLSDYDGSIPLFINGISGVGSPYWIASFHSRFIGEENVVAKTIAVIESIVFLITVNINLMKTKPARIIKVTGGLSVIDRLCQKLADLTEIEVSREENKEATLMGVFYLLSGSSIQMSKKADMFKPVLNESLTQRFNQWTEVMQNE
jgi:glycerol kinase